MKVFFVSFVVVLSILSMTQVAKAEVPDAKFFVALADKESGTNDNVKPGDGGVAFGRYQIRQKCVDDVNEKCNTQYRAEECQGNAQLSQWIAERYLDRWATEAHLGHKPTYQDYARIWNGGPSGCFENGAIDKHGRRPTKAKLLANVIRCQKNAEIYWEDLQKRLTE